MTANPNYSSLKSGWKSKSVMSKAPTAAKLAAGAYVSYKVGKTIGGFGSFGYNMMPYYYGPYYFGYSPFYQRPYMFYGENYNR